MFKLCVGLVFIVVVVSGNPIGNHTKSTNKSISSFLDKFHQNDYKMTFERIESVRVDKRYADFQCRTFKYNRTTPLTNASCILNIEAGNQAEVIFQAYRFASNEYRLFPIHFQLNFCDAIASSAVGLDRLRKTGNVFCPLRKGKLYYVNNFAPDGARFPPLVPDGQYMVELQFLFQSIEVFVLHGYITISRPILIPDN